jgi:hypothetical protein
VRSPNGVLDSASGQKFPREDSCCHWRWMGFGEFDGRRKKRALIKSIGQ